ncbi:pilus assembly protein [Sphingomonas sp. UBA978]|uniref:pilus assembly protein n=1 Tax=Sphingomonas sp. UBA978 TaxID=1947536 RepID=UPI0025F8B95A|nr:pilus assembly protein [Sphingomonas sp. UBA978]
MVTVGCVFRRLSDDRRGNVLAMTAAAIFPLMAMIGGAIDLSRLYMTNTRLQQACDAGALAARRTMADVNTLSESERKIAVNYFKFNFPDNAYSAGTPVPTYTRGAVGTVAGAVSLAVPMTIMKMFGYNTVTLNVTCQSTLVVPNTDVMFVLDVTGSMSEVPSGDTQSKLSGLKQAVKDFYSALGPGTASGAGRIRYGFMPYSSNVNVGKIVYGLNRSYISGGNGSENVQYRSRVPRLSSTIYNTSSGPQRKFVSWSYQSTTFDISSVVQNASAPNPTYFSGYAPDTKPNVNKGYDFDAWNRAYETSAATPATISWGGCIEEASTVNTITSTSPLTVPYGANDLNIDLIPSSAETRWKPYLPAIQFDDDGYWLGRGGGWIDRGFAACPREASPLTQYQSDYSATTKLSTSFESYVNSLTAVGGTYHDIGLVWGARFLSQSGIYSATNADSTGPGGFSISRHIVFMTDGTLDNKPQANDPWGINNLEARIAPINTDEAGLEAIHKRRTSIICNAMKGKGFTVWVIAFGISKMPQELQDCASDAAHASIEADSAALKTRFQQIAQTIGGLRLSQ